MTLGFGSRPAWLVLSAAFMAGGWNGFAQAPGTIITVAGTGLEGYAGDGGPATAAQLRPPCCVAVDSAGNLFIGDAANHRIRKVSPSGVIATVAGTGERGYSGDGGPATAARLSHPGCVVLDSTGNLFIADVDNHRIRKVSPPGIISTVAGAGTPGFSGDGGPAIAALMSYPVAVALDSAGNLFVADTGNHRIRKVSPSGIISTVAGTSTAGFSGDGGPASSAQLNDPFGLAADSAGNLLIADRGNSSIRKVNPSGIISTVAGAGTPGFGGDGGPATSAQLHSPFGIAVDSGGNLFIADTRNNRIRKVMGAGGGACALSCSATAPSSALVGEPVSFSATATLPGCIETISYSWSFNGLRFPGQNLVRTFTKPGTHTWIMRAIAGASVCSQSGSLVISSKTDPKPAAGSGTQRLRIRPLDEARTPENVTGFPGQTLYWHYAVETEAGTPAAADKVSVAVSPLGFSPLPEAFAFQMEEPGHLVMKAEVDALNVPPSCSGCSFSFRPGADSVTLDGQPYELTDAPPAVRLSISDPPIIDAWDVFGELSAGGTGCLAFCRQAEGASVSVAAARLAGPLSGGIGLRLEQDRRQLHRAGRGISLSRRFSLSQGAQLRVPLFDFRPSPVGTHTGGGYGFSGSQAVSYGGESEKEARLINAAFLLESLSLAGVPLPPTAGVILAASVDTIGSLKGGTNLTLKNRIEWIAGPPGEAAPSPDLGSSDMLEQQAGADFGPESGVLNYVGRIRWAGMPHRGAIGDLASTGRHGSFPASALDGTGAFEYGHELRLSPSLTVTSLETFFGAAQAQYQTGSGPDAGPNLQSVVTRYRYGQAGVVEALRSAIPNLSALSHLAKLAAPGAVAAPLQSFTVGTLRQTTEQIDQVRKAAQDATQGVAYTVTSDVASSQAVAVEAKVRIPIPAADLSFDLGFDAALLRERKLVEAGRSVAVQGREWKTSEFAGYPDDTRMPDLPNVLRDTIFNGLGPWIEDAWQRRVTSLTAVVPQVGLTALEVRDRVTSKLVATLSASADHAGKKIQVLSYSADRPEATGVNVQGVVTAAQWRYTTTRIAGESAKSDLQHAGVPSGRLVVVGNVVDVSARSDGGTAQETFQPPLLAAFSLESAQRAKYGVGATDLARVGLYRYDADAREWSAVASSLLAGGHSLQAHLAQPGVYAPGLVIAAPADDCVRDTDGDGVRDGEERRLGTDPTSAASHPNRAPVLGFIGNRTVRVGSTLEIQLHAHDADGQPMTFSASTLPPGAELDAQNGRFWWTPTAAGEYPVEFRVSDGSLSDTESVLLTAYLDASAATRHIQPPA